MTHPTNCQLSLYQHDGVTNARLDDIDSAPYVKGSDTSKLAAESIIEDLDRLTRAVYNAIAGHDNGMTCDEVEELLDMRHQTASARIWSLSDFALIVKNGERRPTRSGRKATVWVTAAAAERPENEGSPYSGGCRQD